MRSMGLGAVGDHVALGSRARRSRSCRPAGDEANVSATAQPDPRAPGDGVLVWYSLKTENDVLMSQPTLNVLAKDQKRRSIWQATEVAYDVGSGMATRQIDGDPLSRAQGESSRIARKR